MEPRRFKVVAEFEPTGDQPDAISKAAAALERGERYVTMRGVTGSGKTYAMAKIVEATQRPTIVMSHNKTLAAQLYSELKAFFPENAVEYFVSYYDYYQPEAYLPASDTYIQKEVDINADLEKLRYSATTSLLTRPDVIIVASVSCIYGIGVSPERYRDIHIPIVKGGELVLDETLDKLVHLQYERTGSELLRGKFRLRGDILDVFPPGMDLAIRVEFLGDEVDSLSLIHPVTGRTQEELLHYMISPAKFFITEEGGVEVAMEAIKSELDEREEELKEAGRMLEAFRLRQRTEYDLELIETIGWCSGIENYSRYLSDRNVGDAPYTLMDYLPENALVIVDESHVTLPQIRGMFAGDRSRKKSLVENGFRLPSAFDNRPLQFPEWEDRVKRAVFTSATPAEFELDNSETLVEMVVRPTGLIDPVVEVRPMDGAVDDLVHEINETVERGDKVLVTVLTKKFAEELADYLSKIKIRVRYLHSEIDTLGRIAILKQMQEDQFDVLVGINLLREGLDLPIVGLVGILDADQEGFLRSTTSLIQTIGRAARNVNGKVIMYGNKVTKSMQAAIDDNTRKRRTQMAYNEKHGITPTSIPSRSRAVEGFEAYHDFTVKPDTPKFDFNDIVNNDMLDGAVEALEGDRDVAIEVIDKLEQKMREYARAWEFEKAAMLRDKILQIKTRIEMEE